MQKLLILIMALVIASMPAWSRRKNVLTAVPVEPELPAAEPAASADLPLTEVDDTIAPTLMLMPIEVNIDSVAEHRDSMPSAVLAAEVADITEDMSIMGSSRVGVDAMYEFVLTRNSSFDRSIAEAFHELGSIYGIRGDVALCQSLIETGWFLFEGGTAVTPDQHNYCGLGVTRLGLKGHSFDSVENGVRAQMQHLYAYASKRALPRGEAIVDPRFELVKRGVAKSWKELNGRWAANKRYAESIMRVYRQMLEFQRAPKN